MFWLLYLLIYLLSPKIIRAEELRIYDQNVFGWPQSFNRRFKEIIKKAGEEKSDLIFLQEVVLKSTLDKADLTGYTPVYFSKNKLVIKGGLVVLVRNEIKNKFLWDFVEFRNQGKGLGLILVDKWLRKGYLRLCFVEKEFCVINTHLTANYFSKDGYDLQEEQFNQIISENSGKIFLVIGDYNFSNLSVFSSLIDLSRNLPVSVERRNVKLDHVVTNDEDLEKMIRVGYINYLVWVSDHKGIVVDMIY